MDHLTDEELIARCARGDRRAMDALVSRYHSKLLDFAFRHLQDRDAAADVAQKALVRVFQSASSFGARSTFRTWLYTVALNLVRDEFRSRKRRSESLCSELPEGDALLEAEADSGGSLEDAVLDRLGSSEVWNAVNALPEQKRAAVLLRFRQGLNYDEISDVMKVPSGTVRSWVHYALKMLRKSLDASKCEV